MQRILAVLLAGAVALVSVPFVSAQYSEYQYHFDVSSSASSRAPVPRGTQNDPLGACIRKSAGLDQSSALGGAVGSEANIVVDQNVLRACLGGGGSGSLNMRRAWLDQTVWMREYMVALTIGSPESDAEAQRLVKADGDVGAAFAAAHGAAAGDRLTALLNDHVVLATQRLQLGANGDVTGFDAAEAKWRANADDIAALAAATDPSLDKAGLRALLQTRMDLLTKVSIARLQNAWSDDVAALDGLMDNASTIADTLSSRPGELPVSSSAGFFTPPFTPGSSSSSPNSGLFAPASSSSSYSSSPNSGLFGPGPSSSSSSSYSSSGLFGPTSSSQGMTTY